MDVIKSTKEVIDILLPDGDIKGIANPGNWHDARPVTLKGILNDVISQYPDIMWIVPADEEENEDSEDPDVHVSVLVVKVQDEEDAPEPVKGECTETNSEESHNSNESSDGNNESRDQEESGEPAAVEDVDTVEHVACLCIDKKCPLYDGRKCNSPNDPGYNECDYDRGIFPGWDDDDDEDTNQEEGRSEPEQAAEGIGPDAAAVENKETCSLEEMERFAESFEDYMMKWGQGIDNQRVERGCL